uniref:Uncharacterized protein n=1 Tax=Mustela putorius furo TaxID=9669 RepID=M3Y0Q2_MUSPF
AAGLPSRRAPARGTGVRGTGSRLLQAGRAPAAGGGAEDTRENQPGAGNERAPTCLAARQGGATFSSASRRPRDQSLASVPFRHLPVTRHLLTSPAETLARARDAPPAPASSPFQTWEPQVRRLAPACALASGVAGQVRRSLAGASPDAASGSPYSSSASPAPLPSPEVMTALPPRDKTASQWQTPEEPGQSLALSVTRQEAGGAVRTGSGALGFGGAPCVGGAPRRGAPEGSRGPASPSERGVSTLNTAHPGSRVCLAGATCRDEPLVLPGPKGWGGEEAPQRNQGPPGMCSPRGGQEAPLRP